MARDRGTSWLRGDDRFIELIEALSKPAEAWHEPEQPDILTALDELAAWAADTRVYKRIHESGWISAIEDFQSAAGSLGSHVQLVLRPYLDAIHNTCRLDVGRDQLLRKRLRSEIAALRTALGEVATLKAAWEDLSRSCSREDSPIGKVEHRRDAFWAIVRASDRNATELSNDLCGVLSGRRLDAQLVRVKLGEADPETVRFELKELPYSDIAERLSLVAKLLDSKPKSHRHVVWFAYKDAALKSIGLQSGSMQFYYADWLYGNLYEGGPFREKLPEELITLMGQEAIPNQDDVVLVRVDVGIGTFSDAVRVANEQIDALLGIAMIDSPLPWKQIPGFIHAQDGKVVSTSYFNLNDEQTKSTYVMNGTAADLDRMAPRITPLIPMRDPQFTEIIDALHWWRSGQTQPTAASIVLNVRVIELVASRLGETSWTTFLEKYVKNRWLNHAVMHSIYRPTSEALHGYSSHEARMERQGLFHEIISSDGHRQSFKLAKAASSLEAIMALVPVNTVLGRDLRTLKRQTSSADAIQRWIAKLENIWGRSIHRLERVRNSIAHGGPFTEAGVQLSQPLSRRLSVWVLWESIEGFLNGKTLAQSHQDVRDEADRWRATLPSASSISDLFR